MLFLDSQYFKPHSTDIRTFTRYNRVKFKVFITVSVVTNYRCDYFTLTAVKCEFILATTSFSKQLNDKFLST